MSIKRMVMTTALSLALAAPAVSFAADMTGATTSSSTSIASKQLLHADVQNPQGDKIGDVEGVVLDKTGQTQAVVVDVGGFLGMGEHRVALGWSDLQVIDNGKKVTSKYSKDQLKAMPEYKYPEKTAQNTAFYDPNYHTTTSTTTTRSGGGTSSTTTQTPSNR